ncbi:hypothetical protein TVNIR_3302 [Thioalkalivibrio nitratireducens DSM 14787]|uniref:Nucleotidyltransferase n=1 Tax=Thioalkalivibrio nitratireducens (strain DSM 14787 / UNIQEM 213 / ALEN2) TaxID=1255043 RepID=L0DZD0_THIND|nr:hypothetical protein [Thioalkalivibrio nitratireducens]AGA34939.1 hypothetical protein TVNIR_3302 [Thioalkalivibrio nitratireducens DSM 14787]
MASLEDKLPLSGSQLATLDDEAVQDLDQFVLRFGRLQDAIGARLLPAVLRVLQEPFEDRPVIDKLNRLEKLGFLQSSERWQRLRAIRNRCSQDYPEDPDKNAALLNVAFRSVDDVMAILKRIEQKMALPPI